MDDRPEGRIAASRSNKVACTPAPERGAAGCERLGETRERNLRRRVAAANARDAAAQARDAAAAARDLAAELRERKWNARHNTAIGESRAATGTEVLLRAAQYRRASAMDRAAVTEMRAIAATERTRAAADREHAARDRARAQRDREALLRQLASAELDGESATEPTGLGNFEEADAALAGGTKAADGFRELFWRVFGISQHPMLLLDQERRIAAVNHAQASVLGYAREEMLGHRLDAFCAPNEWQLLDAHWRTFQRRGVFSGNRTLMRADGAPVTVQYAAHWARVAGRSIALHVALSADASPRGIRTLPDDSGETLSARELEVLGWVALGRRAHEIAAELGIASTTVESHVRSAMRKVGARSQAQLVAVACAQGLLDLSAASTTA
ncbi:MAG: LuxR C-terminal-related transcriptional regulator [Solirubrobacteraceae bacterium]|jgi:PAS domain S-box-containing protein